MLLNRLSRTTVFRLAVVYATLFSVSILVLMGFLYWQIEGYLARQTDNFILSQSEDLADVFATGGVAGLHAAIDEDLQEDIHKQRFYLLADYKQQKIAGNLATMPIGTLRGRWLDFTVSRGGAGHRVKRQVRAQLVPLKGELTLLVGRDTSDLHQVKRVVLDALGWGMALTLALAAAGGVVMSLGVVRRLEEINRTSRTIIAGDLSHRIPLRGTGDDFDLLAGNLNAMLDQIEVLMTSVKGVSDNIAHDLRTPLARLRTRLEIVRDAPPAPEAYEDWIDETTANVDAVLDTFEALLKIAEIEAGALRRGFAPVDLLAVVRDVVEFYEPLAEERQQRLTMTETGVPSVRGDRDLLFRALANLLDNAVKHTPRGGRIDVAVGPVEGGAMIVVADNGPGIPPDERQRVFQRLYRLEGSRSKPGSGLGLSLVAAVAGLHGAIVTLDDNRPGLRVSVTLAAGIH